MKRILTTGLFFLIVLPLVMASCPVPESFISSRPTEEATQVEIGVLMVDIIDVDNVDQMYTVDVFITQRWTDKRLIPYASQIAGCTLEEIWSPKLIAVNRRETNTFYEDIKVSPEGVVTYTERHYGDLTARLDLREFPFDTNTLPLIITSRYSADEIFFVINQSSISRVENFSITDWQLGQPTATVRTQSFRKGGNELPVFEYSIEAKRKSGFVIGKLFLPLLFIIFMSWTVFWIDSKKMFASQLSISAISMLNIIAYLFAFSSLMPRLDYLTKADKVFIGAAILVLCSLFQTVLTSALSARGKEQLANRIDFAARWVFPSAFLLLLFFTLVV